MIILDMSIMIDRPVGEVFDFMSAPENNFQWQYGTLATARLSEGVSSIGTFFRSIGHSMGQRNLSTFEVTEYEPNRKYAFKSLSGPFRLQTAYTFEMADNSRTKINISIQAGVVDFVQMDEGILEKKMRKQLQENLAVLRKLLEARQILPAPGINKFINTTGN
ncbi:MAG TPA: SRPBCC family protein [Anaerolineales bacterium]|nr:SRPBCC family protein [Anaerolineales bacterium]